MGRVTIDILPIEELKPNEGIIDQNQLAGYNRHTSYRGIETL